MPPSSRNNPNQTYCCVILPQHLRGTGSSRTTPVATRSCRAPSTYFVRCISASCSMPWRICLIWGRSRFFFTRFTPPAARQVRASLHAKTFSRCAHARTCRSIPCNGWKSTEKADQSSLRWSAGGMPVARVSQNFVKLKTSSRCFKTRLPGEWFSFRPEALKVTCYVPLARRGVSSFEHEPRTTGCVFPFHGQFAQTAYKQEACNSSEHKERTP